MILVRKSEERVRERLPGQEAWLTFGPSVQEPFGRFGNLEVFREGRFGPRDAVREPRKNAEIITYVRRGSIAFEDSLGLTGVLRQGDFQRMTVGSGLRYAEMNVSSEHDAHVFQIWLGPSDFGLQPGNEKRRFSDADRRGRLRLVVSPEGTDGSLTIHQDAFLYSGILSVGQRVVHPIGSGRGAWIHVVEGSVTLDSVVLKAGDGAGLTKEDAATMSVTEPTEILLLDLCDFEAKSRGAAPTIEEGEVLRSGDNGSSRPRNHKFALSI